MRRVAALTVMAGTAVVLAACSGPGPARSTSAAPAASNSPSGVVLHAQAVAVHYRQVGSGSRVVVLLHGGPGVSNEEMLRAFAPLAKRGFRVVYYDQRDVGASPQPRDADYSPAAYVADLDALRRRLGVTTIDLIGHSWGGAVAAFYAAAHPGAVDKVVEIGGEPLDPAAVQRGGVNFQHRLTALEARHVVPEKPLGPDGDDCAAELRAIAPVYSADPGRPYRIPATVPCSSTASQFTADALDADRDQVRALRRALAGWHGQALIVQGAEDPFGAAFTDADVAQYAGARVTREVVPDAGHSTWDDDPSLVGQIGDFLSR